MGENIKKTLENSLKVSEFFYSIQGEGPQTGYPAWFLRLTGCNLDCPWCDTTEVWRKGERKLFERIPDPFPFNIFVDSIAEGDHLVITGGEPLLQQQSICSFINFLHEEVLKKPFISKIPFIEIETNGTIKPNDYLFTHVGQWNVSPKLWNSKEPREKRYVPGVLSLISVRAGQKAVFKFVIQSEEDIDEIMNWYVDPGLIKKEQVWLMPMADNINDLHSKGKMVVGLCKKYHFKYSNRLHIQLWNQTVGV